MTTMMADIDNHDCDDNTNEKFTLGLRSIRVVHRPRYKGPFGMDYREQGSHARSVYPTQYTSRMVTARVKQEEERDRLKNPRSNSKRGVRNLEKERGHE